MPERYDNALREARVVFCLLLCSCATATPCEPVNPVQAEQAMRVAWAKVFAGEPLDDADLQALSDAHDVLECHAEKHAEGRGAR